MIFSLRRGSSDSDDDDSDSDDDDSDIVGVRELTARGNEEEDEFSTTAFGTQHGPERMADYYWGQAKSDVLFSVSMPEIILELREKLRRFLGIPKLTVINNTPPQISYGKIGDSVPSLNSCIVIKYVLLERRAPLVVYTC
jgi:hypothetical protein